MALIKSMSLTSDVNITYWNIEEISHIKDKEQLHFVIRGYSSEQYRMDDVHSYLYKEAITIPDKSVADIQGNLYEVAYEALKEYPDLPEKFKVVVSEEVPAVLDDNREIITEAIPAVYKSWFEDAETSL